MRLTYPTALVLQALLGGHHHGFDIMDATGLPSGTVYPILGRLQERGLVSSRWEAADAHRSEGRPARKYYRLTVEGRSALQAEVERFRALGRPLPRQA